MTSRDIETAFDVPVWSYDRASCYEVDEGFLARRKADGVWCYVYAVGCSCWDGEYVVEEYPTMGDAFGPLGIPFDVRDAEFRALLK